MKRICVLILFLNICNHALAQVSKESELYKTVIKLDKELFDAYNDCTNEDSLKKHGAFYSEEIEFFHDMGGLQTSKKELVESIKNNICGKVKRELVEDSIEVHEIPNYGVIMMGYHKFHNLVENSISKPSKFIGFWRKDSKQWKLAKVVSLH